MLDLARILGPALCAAVVACICLVRTYVFAKALIS